MSDSKFTIFDLKTTIDRILAEWPEAIDAEIQAMVTVEGIMLAAHLAVEDVDFDLDSDLCDLGTIDNFDVDFINFEDFRPAR